MSKQSNNSPFAPLTIGFFIGAVAVGTVVLLWNHDRESLRYPAPAISEKTATPTAPPVLDSTAFSRLNSTVAPVVDPAVTRVRPGSPAPAELAARSGWIYALAKPRSKNAPSSRTSCAMAAAKPRPPRRYNKNTAA